MKSMKKYKKGGKKFPDLTGDGKVTFADVLKGRGVKKAKYGMKYEDGGKAPKKYSTLAGDAKAAAEAKASKGAGKSLVYDEKSSVAKGRDVFRPADEQTVHYMKGEGGLKVSSEGLDRGGEGTKKYVKFKKKEFKQRDKAYLAKTKAGKAIHNTLKRKARRKAEQVGGKFQDSRKSDRPTTYASFGDGGRVQKVLDRAKKKAERIHEREAKKEAKGKDVEVLGTRRVNTGVGNPRFMNQPRGTEKVYAKEREAINKGDVKAAEIEGKINAKSSTSRKPASKHPKVKGKKSRPKFNFGKGRADKPRGGGVKRVLKNTKNIIRNIKKGCFNRGDC